jgi:hypothetical protein
MCHSQRKTHEPSSTRGLARYVGSDLSFIIWELLAGPNTLTLPLGTIFLCTQVVQAGYSLCSFQAKPRCLVAVRARILWTDFFTRSILNHAFNAADQRRVISGRRVGRVRTSPPGLYRKPAASCRAISLGTRKKAPPIRFTSRSWGTSFTKKCNILKSPNLKSNSHSSVAVHLAQLLSSRATSCTRPKYPTSGCLFLLVLNLGLCRFLPPLSSLAQHPRQI